MAVVNTLNTNTTPFVHPLTASKTTGQRTKKILTSFTTTASDSNNSIYFAGMLPDNAVVVALNIHCADITSANDVDVNLYDQFGTLKAASYYADALDLSQHSTVVGTAKYASTYNHLGMGAVTAAAALDPVWKNAGDVEGPVPASGSTLKTSKYQIGLLFNAGPTAAITGIVEIDYMSVE